jgi:L-lysine 2,3-aminomutase
LNAIFGDNDDPDVWAKIWRMQTRLLGIIPYYMFVECDTGAKHYFEVSLARAWKIYREAVKQVSGLSRTVRGPP